MNETVQFLIGVILSGAFITGIVELIRSPKVNRKIKAETGEVDATAAATLSAAAISLIAPYKEQVEDLHRRIDELEPSLTAANKQLVKAERTIQRLIGKLERYEEKYGPLPD